LRRNSWRAAGSELRTAPAYQALRDQLRDEIAAGRYRNGVRLPTESELVSTHGLSRQTVRRAFQDLVAEGVVYRVPGRGTYTSDTGRRYLRQLGSIEDLMSLSDDTTMQVLTGLRRRVDLEAASRLRLDDDIVYTVVFRRLHGGVPFVSTSVHLVPSVAAAVAETPELRDGAAGSQTVIGILEPHLEEPIAEAAQSITVAPADATVAEALSCQPGHPMLRVDRLYSDAAKRPVELSISHFLPEQYTYRVTLRRSG
jgi:GntR family transcriptional regulator